MKKIFLLAATFASFFFSAQTGDLYLQNYTPHYIFYTVWKMNAANTSGGCAPRLQSNNSGLAKLTFSPSPGTVSIDAYHQKNLNTSNTFNASYPNTPLIDNWVLNGNYAASISLATTPPQTIPPIFNNLSDWAGIKFGVTNQAGVNIGGYYSMGHNCGDTFVGDLTPGSAISGSYFTAGGSTWIVFF